MQCKPHLQRGTGGVVHIGQDLHRLLEHNTEGAGRTIAAETCVVLAKDCVAVCVDDLGTEAAQLPGPELGKQGLQELMRAWPGHLGMVSRRWVWWEHGKSLNGMQVGPGCFGGLAVAAIAWYARDGTGSGCGCGQEACWLQG